MKTTFETTDTYLCRIAEMSRRELVREIRTFHCRFPMDFTPDYLESRSVDQLRHILAGAQLHAVAD